MKSKVEPTTMRIKRLLEVLSSYLFNFYYIKGKDMILIDFLLRQRVDDSNPHEIIPLLFNMRNILHDKYYNIKGERINDKYWAQPRSEAKSSRVSLPEVHGIYKGLDPLVRIEKTNDKANNHISRHKTPCL